MEAFFVERSISPETKERAVKALLIRLKQLGILRTRRRQRICMGVGAALVLYGLLGFVLLPLIVRPMAEDYLQQQLQQPSRIEGISFNPFSLALRVEGLLVGRDEDPVIGWERFELNLSWSSLWKGALQIETLRLVRPQLTAGLDRQGKPILLGLIEALKDRPLDQSMLQNDTETSVPEQTDASAARSAAAPSVPAESADGVPADTSEVAGTEQAAPEDAVTSGLRDMEEPTLAGEGTATLPADAANVAGAKPEDTEAAVPDAPEAEAGGLYPVDLERLELIEGRLTFVDLRPEPPVRVRAEAISLALDRISTRAEEQGDLQLEVRFADQSALNWQGRLQLDPLVAEGHLALEGLRPANLQPYLGGQLKAVIADGRLSIETDYRIRYGKDFDLTLDALAVRLQAFDLKSLNGSSSLVRIPDLDISGAQVALADQKLSLGTVRLTDAEVNLDFDHQGTVSLAQLWQPRVETAAPPAQPAAPWAWRVEGIQVENARVTARDLSRVPALWQLEGLSLTAGALHPDAAEVPLQAQVGIDQGTLALSGTLGLSPLAAALDVKVQQLPLVLLNPYLAEAARLRLESGLLGTDLKLGWQPEPGILLGGQLWLEQFDARTLENRPLLGWRRLALEGLEVNQAENRVALADVLLEGPSVKLDIDKSGVLNFSTLGGAEAAPSSAATDVPSKPLQLAIDQVRIQDGTVQFSDQRPQHPFVTQIVQLNGQAKNLSSAAGTRSSFALDGKVDRYAPVKIRGQLKPFAPADATAFSIEFRRLPLTSFSPYSQQYAGYQIRKGRMDLELGYRIERSQLEGDNRVLIEQLRFGDKVDSPDAVDLPVALALSLLKDPSGKIDIDLPVSGDLSNPDFSYGGIVWGALRNVLVKALSSPFTALGGVFRQGQQPDQVLFAAGAAILDETGEEQLRQLGQALGEREEFALELTGLATAADWQHLARLRLRQQALEHYNRDAWFKVERAEELSESQYFEGLAKAYPGAYDGTATLEELEAALVPDLAYDELAMSRLAHARAQAVQAYLLEEVKLAPERLFLLEPELDAKRNAPPAARLGLTPR